MPERFHTPWPIPDRLWERRRRGRREGFSMVELLVAFVVFGIALAGLCPLVVMQSRQFKRLDNRFSPNSTYYLVPSQDQWARKLGAAATLWPQDPGFTESPGPL